ncbi:hypothetical protein [Actinomadura sp. 7K507]|uniref:hypothetical protein n=1 Tax=Actinomadura sp. 7K507 TaxID=2530365 RepID=UPI00104A63A3|nr:hypothetical protein [Actinomadura sp. 7K507]TDC86930.1 hypothetical protein E1285_21660 [Actinomadura sp. 7K507]
MVFEHHFGNRVGVLDLVGGTTTARLLAVADRGAEGWEVAGDAPLAGLLGPQADEITAARIARVHLRGDTGTSSEAARYYQPVDATRDAMDACLDTALTALDSAGADAWWWSTAVSCAHGPRAGGDRRTRPDRHRPGVNADRARRPDGAVVGRGSARSTW